MQDEFPSQAAQFSVESSAIGAPVEECATQSHPMALDAMDLEQTAGWVAGPALWETPEPYALPPHDVEALGAYRGPWDALLKLLRLPLRVAAFGFLAYLFAFNLSVVRGSSMAPGIFDGDRILVDQLSYLFTDIERGDIIVLQYPLDPRLDYIKRVVGVPGDEIVMKRGKLWINGELLEEDYVLERDLHTRMSWVVMPEHYFVLGDNRLHSSDSREFGQVMAAYVRGKVDVRLWPLERMGRIR